MKLAINEMKKSKCEPRSDDKMSPLVGAVLVFSSGEYITAHRGELRDGDHAEFTLLERKCSGRLLEDAVLYATLEPCRRRNPPKRGCAQHIINARIAMVYVGIEDPDPTVAGDGLRYLLDHGCEVRMFDKDLQEEITNENSEFLIQANKRAMEHPSTPLSEQPLNLKMQQPNTALYDLSSDALNFYIRTAGLRFSANTREFYEHLTKIGVLYQSSDTGEFIPTGFGVLLFHYNPREIFPQAALKAQIAYSDGNIETASFEQPLVLMPNEIESWLEKVLRFFQDTSKFQRSSRSEFPIQVIREAIMNALVHRDYTLDGSKTQISISESLIQVLSPGRPLPYISLEQLNSFNAPSVSRNPIIAYVFNKLRYVEEQGFGMKAFRDMPNTYGFPSPNFSFEDPNLVLSFPRSYSATLMGSGSPALAKLTEEELRGYELLRNRKTITRKEYQDTLKLGQKTAERHLARMVELKIAAQKGKARGTYYVWVQPKA
ncbi:ATP-binding protein [Nostoc sp. NIES-2111]